MQRFIKSVLLIFCFVFSKQNFSQDIRGAWIDYKWLSGYTYSVSLNLIIDTTNKVNRPYLDTYFGDGTFCSSPSYTTFPTSKIVIYKYSCTHTYPGTTYNKLFYLDSFRVANIKNINTSINKTFYTESLLSINQFLGPNNSPIITNSPVGFSVSGNTVAYQPGAYDPDGDSLSYHLINCAVSPTIDYYLPSNALVDAYGTLSFSKDSIGLYAFAYLIKEWRKDLDGNFQLIGSMLMDFAMEIDASVGIKELEKKGPLLIYPNPTSNILYLKSNSKHNSPIEIINCLGEIVLKQNYSETVDVSKLSPGYYFIKVGNSYSKFIKE